MHNSRDTEVWESLNTYSHTTGTRSMQPVRLVPLGGMTMASPI